MAAKKKEAVTVERTPESVRAQIEALIDDTNKRLERSGSLGKVYRGNQIRYVECERLTSGSLGLDIIMGGGLAKSRLIEYYGEESAGKTTMSALAVAANQALNPMINVHISAVEGFDKNWWRTNGVYIEYSEDEMENADDLEQLARMQEYNSFASQYGIVSVAQIMAGDKLLEETARIIKTGLYDICVIDSFGAVRPTNAVDEEDEKYREVGDDEMGGNAKMLGRFCGKLDAAFNKRGPNGEENKTAVLGINQVRAKIGGFHGHAPPPPEPTGGFALRHTKSISIWFSKGQMLKEASGSREVTYGRFIRAKCMKNKTAVPHRDCEFPFRFLEHNEVPIGIDAGFEFAEFGVYYGLIEQSGAWYSFNGERIANGKGALADFLNANPELMQEMRPEILRRAKK